MSTANTSRPSSHPSTSDRRHERDDVPALEPDSESSESEEEEDSDDDNTQASPVRGQSGFRYDIRSLTPTSTERIRRGLQMQNLAVSYCVEHTDPNDKTYTAFEITERHVVRIGAPDSQYSQPSCRFCDQAGCRHVIWLLDQIAKHTLAHYQQRSNPDGDLVMEKTGWPGGVPDPFQQISTAGLPKLAKKLRWTIRDEPTTSTADALKSQKDPNRKSLDIPEGLDRKSVVRDMLAVLSPSPVTRYKPEVYENIPPSTTLRDALQQDDFESKLAYLLIAEDDLFMAMRGVFRPGICTTDYFYKMRLEAQKNLDLLEEYSTTGQIVGSSLRYDVPWCARVLQRVVSAIMCYADERAPLERRAKEEAVRSLVYILKAVVHHNYDVYQKTPSIGAGVRNERDRNLYQNLIGSGRDGFVLDAIRDLADAAGGCVEDLEDIQHQAETNGVPVLYKEKLRSLITHLRMSRSVPPPYASGTGSPQKRDSSDFGSGSSSRKRRMK